MDGSSLLSEAPPQAERQAGRQRNAQPKPRAIIEAAWRTALPLAPAAATLGRPHRLSLPDLPDLVLTLALALALTLALTLALALALALALSLALALALALTLTLS